MSNSLAVFSGQRIPPGCWTKMKLSEEGAYRYITRKSFSALLHSGNTKNNNVHMQKKNQTKKKKLISFVKIPLHCMWSFSSHTEGFAHCSHVHGNLHSAITVPYPSTAGGGEKRGCFHLCQGKKQLSYSANCCEHLLNPLLVTWRRD